MADADDKKVILISSDGKQIEVPAVHAKMCRTIHNMLEDLGDDDNEPIPLPNVTENILKKVVDFCKQHENDPLELSEEEEIKLRETPIADWDKEFCDVDLQTLFEMILAANFLDFKPMLNLTCKAVAEMIKGKSPEDIKKIFGIEGDFTEEEKAQVLAENPWLKEDNELEPAAADAAAAKTE